MPLLEPMSSRASLARYDYSSPESFRLLYPARICGSLALTGLQMVALSGEPAGYVTLSSEGVPPRVRHRPRISPVQAMRGS